MRHWKKNFLCHRNIGSNCYLILQGQIFSKLLYLPSLNFIYKSGHLEGAQQNLISIP